MKGNRITWYSGIKTTRTPSSSPTDDMHMIGSEGGAWLCELRVSHLNGDCPQCYSGEAAGQLVSTLQPRPLFRQTKISKNPRDWLLGIEPKLGRSVFTVAAGVNIYWAYKTCRKRALENQSWQLHIFTSSLKCGVAEVNVTHWPVKWIINNSNQASRCSKWWCWRLFTKRRGEKK